MVAFWSGPDGNGGVYVMNADGSERRLLADGGAPLRPEPGRNLRHVAWSPDGRKMLLSRSEPSEGYDSRKVYVVVMNADGSGQRNLTRNPAVDRFPVWSPGRRK